MKPKFNKFKKIHTQINCNQAIKSQNQREKKNLESGKRKVTHYVQKILNQINRNHENNDMRYSKFWGEKKDYQSRTLCPTKLSFNKQNK